MRVSRIVALFALSARVASAQPSSAEAEALFRQGVALMDAGKYAEACAAFDGSQQRGPAITTLFNQAACREKAGQIATAWGWYVEAERQTRTGTDDNTRGLHQLAVERVAQLEPKLSKLTIQVPAGHRVSGLEVQRNGVAVDAAAWGRALPIDGGTYAVTAHAPGYDDWHADVVVKPTGDDQALEVGELTRAKVASPGQPRTHRSLRAPLIVTGAAVAMLAGGLVLELSAEHSYDKYKDVGGDSPIFDTANHKRYVAEGLAAGGIVVAVVAVWLFVRPGAAETSPEPKVAVLPTLTDLGAGLVLTGRY